MTTKRVHFLVSVEVDTEAIIADNPPDDIQESIMDEVRTSLVSSSSVRRALGIVDTSLTPIHFGEREMVSPLPYEARRDKLVDINGFTVCYGLLPQEAEFLADAANVYGIMFADGSYEHRQQEER